jgi:hypothetical protein
LLSRLTGLGGRVVVAMRESMKGGEVRRGPGVACAKLSDSRRTGLGSKDKTANSPSFTYKKADSLTA